MSAQSPAPRLTIDVSLLPETTFGHRALTWWATIAFMLIEATTMGVVAVSYLYLRLNAAEWPPRPASAPRLLLPTINLLVIVATIWPMTRAGAAARRLDLRGTQRWLLIGMAFALVATVLRWFELQQLNVRWDTNAYGSAVWGVMVAHTSLLVTDVLETGAITVLTLTRRMQIRHFSDVEDAGVYQIFLSLSWVLLYVLIYLGPRVL